ncbi:MAG: transposase, IS200/IS605 family (plasmid) [Methyloprofundus sp.]|nr:MAG: transposase, IS200/IS605 family [Methyloprofundus sp.]
MSRFQKLSHVVWFCQYHIVFVPKYRYQILKGDLGKYVYQSIYAHTERAGCEVIELNVQTDHVHLLVKIPPKVSVSNLVGRVKGKTAIQAFQKFPSLRTKKYWGNHFWSAGYCVDTVGMDAEMIRKYVKFQENK